MLLSNHDKKEVESFRFYFADPTSPHGGAWLFPLGGTFRLWNSKTLR
jgi:flavin-dependent dehydrogenase